MGFGFMSLASLESATMATRIVFDKAEADELTMFGFKITSQTLLDDGRTKYVLTSMGGKNNPNTPLLKTWLGEDGTTEDLDWLEED
jgi:hypothetical protein